MNNSSKFFEIMPTDMPNVYALVSKSNRTAMLQYRVSPQATAIQNKELAMSLIDAFTDYCQAVKKGVH